jgi:hypothetical protein
VKVAKRPIDGRRHDPEGVAWLNHPGRGVLHFEYASFQANDDPALKLVIYTPV